MRFIDFLREDTNIYTVYKAYGPNDPRVYYGYAQGTEDEIAHNFTAGVNRTDKDRAEKRMVEINGGDPADIQFEIVDVFADELDAWTTRNDLRIGDPQSLTGPTMFPGGIFARAQKERPEKIAQWTKVKEFSRAKNAKEAWNMGMWPHNVIMDLTKTYPRQQVSKDLDRLKPAQFATKYGL